MTGNQTMDYYVRPRHLYSHSRTCTRSGLCRRPSRWVHLLYATSLIVPVFMRFQLSWLVPVYVRYFQPLWRSWSIIYLQPCGDHGPLYIFIMEILIYVYCTWRWPHMFYHFVCLFMAIVLLCIRDCYMYSQLYAELYYWIMLIGWLVFHLGTFITSFLGWTYNVFRPSYIPSDLMH